MVPKNPYLSKGLLERLWLPLLVILVGVAAFGLGRLSAGEQGGGGLRIYQEALPAATGAAAGEERRFVASKSGSRYYLPTCSGAKQIKEENKVWFGTKEAAEATGYTPAANCPGL
jgi:hypothetical protein